MQAPEEMTSTTLRGVLELLTCALMPGETIEDRVERLVLEYAQSLPVARPIDPRLSLRNDLVIESLSLVSLTLRLGDELGVDLSEVGLELGEVKTVGDLVAMARSIATTHPNDTISRSATP